MCGRTDGSVGPLMWGDVFTYTSSTKVIDSRFLFAGNYLQILTVLFCTAVLNCSSSIRAELNCDRSSSWLQPLDFARCWNAMLVNSCEAWEGELGNAQLVGRHGSVLTLRKSSHC